MNVRNDFYNLSFHDLSLETDVFFCLELTVVNYFVISDSVVYMADSWIWSLHVFNEPFDWQQLRNNGPTFGII